MMKQSFSKAMKTILVTTLAAVLVVGCQSKKKSEDAIAPDAAGGQTPPTIESTPMSFDAAGSDSGRIDGLNSINFDYDKATLSPESKKKIQGNVAWMKSNGSSKLQIEGHCDARGSIEYNLSLGERRAQAVKTYMSSLGIPAGRLSIISYGKEKPLAGGDSEADYAKNRRANFVPLNN